MPIVNTTRGTTCPLRVLTADRAPARLVGLLGTVRPDPTVALHIVPCSGIHTFGMKYPIDALFLDAKGRVVQTEQRVASNKVVKPVFPAKSVLELPAGAIREWNIRLNDRMRVVSDGASRPDLKGAAALLHRPMNAFIAFLWCRFVLIALNGWFLRADPLNFGIVLHNTLLTFFFLFRRNSREISLRPLDWVIPVLTLSGALMLKPGPSGGGAPGFLSFWIQCLGMAGIIFSLLSLGRSFGIVPANRKIVGAGAYGIVRHPMYLSEMVFYAGFLAGNPSVWNALLVLTILAGQLYRSVSEEHLLATDPEYHSYRQRVRFRFIPGLF
jgi:protein-S-isoprenylcysteine O-methyltransferase Ste14/uncharacterized membrane protein (UPF0127 family)